MQIERNIVSIQPKQTRLIRAPLLRGNSNSHAEETAQKSTQSRFVEPYQMGEEEGAVVARLLDELEISDEEGRRLFMLALEYEIGAYQQIVIEHLEPLTSVPAADQGLADLADVARILSDRLEALEEPTRDNLLRGIAEVDPFKRSADRCYLRSLQCEIDRLAAACRLQAETGAAMREPLNEASRKFILMLANIYTECFESPPCSTENGPFDRILKCVVEQTDLSVRVDLAFLEQTLSRKRA